MNYISQAVTISHYLQFKHNRALLIPTPKIIFTCKSCFFKWAHSLKQHLPPVSYMVYVMAWKQRSLADQSSAFASSKAMSLAEKGFAEGPGRPQSLLPSGIAVVTENLFVQLHKGWSIPLSPTVTLHHSVFKLCCRDYRTWWMQARMLFHYLKTFEPHTHNKYWQGGEMKASLHLTARLTNGRGECVGNKHSRKPCAFYWCTRGGLITC